MRRAHAIRTRCRCRFNECLERMGIGVTERKTYPQRHGAVTQRVRSDRLGVRARRVCSAASRYAERGTQHLGSLPAREIAAARIAAALRQDMQGAVCALDNL